MKTHRIRHLSLVAAGWITACTAGGGPLATSPSTSPWVATSFPVVVTGETTVEIVGSGFGTHGEVMLGDQAAKVVEWSDTKVVIEAPHSATGACSSLQVLTDQGESNRTPLGFGEHNIWVPKHAFAPAMHQVGDHTSVWTGRELLEFDTAALTGYRYRPDYDVWLPLNMKQPSEGYPSGGRTFWTGSKLFVWNGTLGATIDPNTDEWSTPIPMAAGAPAQPQVAAWGGNALFVYGGVEQCADAICPKVPFSDGIYYGGMWHELPPAPEPFGRDHPIVIWTGTEFIVFGGGRISKRQTVPAQGGIAYNPKTNAWRSIDVPAPTPNFRTSRGYWLDGKLLVLGTDWNASPPEESTWLLDFTSNTWAKIDDGTQIRGDAQVVTTATKVIVSGGMDYQTDEIYARFAIYDVVTGRWESPRTPERIAGRVGHTMFSDGSAVYIIGGYSRDGIERGGGRYDLATKKWRLIGMQADEPPLDDQSHVFWTGSELIVYGTARFSHPTREGARYNPATDTWVPMPEATDAGYAADVVWTGTALFLWGGVAKQWPDAGFATPVSASALYHPQTNQWKAVSTLNAPTARTLASVVSTGNEVIVWGGVEETGIGTEAYQRTDLQDGASFNLTTGRWSRLPVTGSPDPKSLRWAVWSGDEMMIWGTRSQVSSGKGPSAAAYNPTSHTWREIAPLPAETWADDRQQVQLSGHRVVYSSRDPRRALRLYDSISDTWTTITLPAKEPEFPLGAVVASGDEVYLFPEWWDLSHADVGGIAVNLETGEQKRLNAPCGFTAPFSVYNHFVSTGDRILSWGDGGVSAFIP